MRIFGYFWFWLVLIGVDLDAVAGLGWKRCKDELSWCLACQPANVVAGAQMATTVVERQQPRAPPLLDQQPLTGVNDIPNANTCSFILQVSS